MLPASDLIQALHHPHEALSSVCPGPSADLRQVSPAIVTAADMVCTLKSSQPKGGRQLESRVHHVRARAGGAPRRTDAEQGSVRGVTALVAEAGLRVARPCRTCSSPSSPPALSGVFQPGPGASSQRWSGPPLGISVTNFFLSGIPPSTSFLVLLDPGPPRTVWSYFFGSAVQKAKDRRVLSSSNSPSVPAPDPPGPVSPPGLCPAAWLCLLWGPAPNRAPLWSDGGRSREGAGWA